MLFIALVPISYLIERRLSKSIVRLGWLQIVRKPPQGRVLKSWLCDVPY